MREQVAVESGARLPAGVTCGILAARTFCTLAIASQAPATSFSFGILGDRFAQRLFLGHLSCHDRSDPAGRPARQSRALRLLATLNNIVLRLAFDTPRRAAVDRQHHFQAIEPLQRRG